MTCHGYAFCLGCHVAKATSLSCTSLDTSLTFIHCCYEQCFHHQQTPESLNWPLRMSSPCVMHDLQTTARHNSIPIDSLAFEFSAVNVRETELQQPPKEGVYIKVGGHCLPAQVLSCWMPCAPLHLPSACIVSLAATCAVYQGMSAAIQPAGLMSL